MHAIIDGDILRYEVGFAAETSWKYYRGGVWEQGDLPDYEWTDRLLNKRIQQILNATEAETYTLYLSEGECFRVALATVKPYKGTRSSVKPFHFANLSAVMKAQHPTVISTLLEADDQMAIDHIDPGKLTVLCSRDKDLRQVPGNYHSWELGESQPARSLVIDEIGHLVYDPEKVKLFGTGYLWFAAQALTGDSVDNIPGLKGCGPKKAWTILGPLAEGADVSEIDEALIDAYDSDYELLFEQANLVWMVRGLHPDGSPILWSDKYDG